MSQTRRNREARDMVLRMVANFPGLVTDEEDVNGADLVDWISNEVHHMSTNDPELIDRAKNGTPCDEEESE